MSEDQEARDSLGELRRPGAQHEADLELAREALGGSLAARRRFAETMLCVPKFLTLLNGRQARPLTAQELEDVAQETLVQIWSRLDSYAGLASLSTWAYRFCQHTLSAHRRGLRRRDHAAEQAVLFAPSELDGAHRDYSWVHAALERLREPDGTIVRQRHFEQLGFGAIAKRLGMPESSAKAAYQRGLARLRDLLGRELREGGA